jgi:alkane 1-monooxygenase
MDHRVVDHFDGDISRANLHPRTQDKYIARYGSGSMKEAA